MQTAIGLYYQLSTNQNSFVSSRNFFREVQNFHALNEACLPQSPKCMHVTELSQACKLANIILDESGVTTFKKVY